MQRHWRWSVLLGTFCLGLVGCGVATDQTGNTAQPQATAILTTPWTGQVSQTLPLPEYPRPQMTRNDWLNLNGKWSYFGGAASPNAENPPSSAPNFPANPAQILVPYPVESYLSNVQRRNERNLWYKRSFSVPAGWNGRRVILNFGAVDRSATVYVNGQQVGRHSGGYDAFSFDITPFLRAGNNDLVVGAFDPTDGSDMVGKQTQTPGGIFYTPTSGIWQTVWLEPVAAPHITRLELTPDVGGNRLRVVVRGEGLNGQILEAAVTGGSSATGSVGLEFSVSVPNARLWSPDDPFLYALTVRVRDGGGALDEVQSYFGMRSISVGTVGGVPRPLLNGKFVFQYGPLDQGFWPDGLYTAPTDEALKSDLVQLKNLGFNMVRKHIKIEPQRWYYWADKLGLMVWQDMPQAWDAESNQTARNRYETGAREIVDEHRSSPAIVTWVVFNESWGDYNIPSVVNTFRGWDSSRLINAFSGINFAPGDTGAGDLIDLHDYPGPSAPNYQLNRPAVLGEFGGNCLRVIGHMWNPNSTCPYTTYPDSNSLTNAYVDQVNRLRELVSSKGLSAAVYTETSDVEDELNGFLTYDRQIQKMDFARAKAANSALVSGVPYLRVNDSYSFRTVSPGVTSRYLRHQNSLGLTEVVNSSSPEVLKKDASWKVVSGLADAGCVSLESISLPGSFLRHAASRLRIDVNNNTDAFRQDATFCPRAALDSGGGVSLESKNFPGLYVRHRNSEVWLDPFQDNAAYRADASWAAVSGWWRSSATLPIGQNRSLRVLTPGFDNRYIRHQNSLGFTEVVNANSDNTLKQDATFRLVVGLADASCYSFESRNFPNQYLRHRDSRIYKEALDGGSVSIQDATFCAQSAEGGGVRLAAYNFPNRFIRHYAAEVWIADGLGGSPWNSSGGLANDTRWSVDNPWSP